MTSSSPCSWGVLTVVLGGALGCAPTLDDLAPFPCALDKTCPSGFVCAGERGCAREEQLGELVPFACGDDQSCPNGFTCLEGYGCVPDAERCEPAAAAPSCPSPDRPKCSLIARPDGGVGGQCVPATGAVAIGGVCTRDFAGAANSGRDNCAPGGFCSLFYGAGASSICRALCDASSDCAANETCAQLFSGEKAGVCVPRCQLGQECGEGRFCDLARIVTSTTDYFGACLAHGTLAEGARCDETSETCGKGLHCFGSPSSFYYCTRICADGVACADGFCDQDTRFAAAGASAGLCSCELFGSCGAGKSCKLRGDADLALDFCDAAGTQPQGATCSGPAACLADHSCLGRTGGKRYCLANCDATHPCTGNGVCRPLESGDDAGICQCGLFAGDCAAGNTCSVYGDSATGGFSLCRPIGPGAVGAPCQTYADCGAGTQCWGSGSDYRCRPVCDTTHPCAAGLGTCRTVAGVANGGGVCF